MRVSIRPLEIRDAYTSVLWRNDPDIWRYTWWKAEREITLEMELEWITKALAKPDEKRFAICVGETMEYVGNVQLTDITPDTAQFHIFIGMKKYHGKGIGTEATKLMLDHAFNVMRLKKVYLNVKHANIAAIKSYEHCGFNVAARSESDITMVRERT